jgi:hypothetical protein
MDCTVRKNSWKMSVLTDCQADSGTAETYTADENKMAVSPIEGQYLCCGTGRQHQLFKWYSKETKLPNFGFQIPKIHFVNTSGIASSWMCDVPLLVMRWPGPPSFKRRPRTLQIISNCLSCLQSRRWHTINQTFPFNKMASLHTGALQSGSLWIKLFQRDGLGGKDQSLGPLAPRYNPIKCFLLRPYKGPDIPPKSWQCGWTSRTNIQCSCFCDTPDAGKYITWNRVPSGHSASYRWHSH